MTQNDYSDSSFWGKLTGFALQAGREVVEKSLWLYYAAQRPETPLWAKTIMFGALAYFISPVDAIPDITPVVGYADDLGAISAAIAMVSLYINADVKEQAKQQLKRWFG